MPNRVIGTLLALWLQILSTGFLGYVLLSDIDYRLNHGEQIENLGRVRAIAYGSCGVAAVLLVCAVLAVQRFAWVRTVVLGIEGLTLLTGAIVAFSTGTPVIGVGFALPVIVMSAFLSRRAQEWFNR